MKETLLLPIISAIALASTALAQELPTYASDDHCQGRWHSDTKMKNVCMQQQQASFDALKASWASIPAKIVQDCRSEWDEDNDYVMLQFCVEQEVLTLGRTTRNPN